MLTYNKILVNDINNLFINIVFIYNPIKKGVLLWLNWMSTSGF